MGELKSKRIVQSRIWLDPDSLIIPDYDYDFSYPITVYDAVKQNMDDNSATLTDEIASIYRLIYSKQDIVEPGIAGQLMTFTGVRGQIGAIDIVKMINKDPAQRSHSKVVSERAIGDLLDTKVSLSSFNNHINDGSIHINDVERSRWNAMAPLSTLQAHISNTIVHVTDTERANWNSKAKQSDLDDHIYNMNNPHNVTAHQTGTYTRREIDEMFENIRASFFNYLNISWDDRNNQATLSEYHPANWNPNYILSYEDELPDVPDPSLTYFALKPATDYKTNETQDCIIYVKRPGLTWQEVGFQTMQVGDMVIRYPDTTMFVWVQGRWLKLFTGNKDDEIGGGKSDLLWRPNVDEEGTLTFELSKSTDPPGPFIIKGEDGYTPVKGIDYVDGKDGEGVAIGGVAGDLLVKLTDENFDTSWKSFLDILNDYAVSGGVLPDGLVLWEYIKGRPQWYNSLGDNEDGFITQRAATRQFEVVGNNINQILERLDLLEPIKEDLYDHINDFNNPHRVTPAMIGAITTATFLDHTQNFNNPHNVTATQIGLGNVNNTSDMDKPISTAVQLVIDEILKKIADLGSDLKGLKYISNVTWDQMGCDIIFEYEDGTQLSVHLPIIEIFSSIYYDQAEKELVIVLPNGDEHRVDIAALIQEYFGSISDNIQVSIDDDNVIKATVVPGSIGELEITSSVHLRGAPTTMTQPVSDRSTRIATTEFVSNQVIDNLISYDTDRPLSANMGRILNEKKADIDEVIKLINDMSTVEVIDNLDSTNPLAALSANMGRHLDLTKAPRVHTSPSGSTFGRATISLFGHARASDIDPLMDGTVFRGTDDGYYARADHRHPTDVTRAPMHWPDVGHNQYELTGKPCTVTPPDSSNDHQIANTEWVRRNAVGVNKGYCHTSKTNPNKVVELKSTYCDPVVFIRQLGSTVSVLFDYEDRSGKTPTTLDVQNTGAAEILFGGRPMTNGMLGKNHEHMFVWDEYDDGRQYWRLINPVPGTGYGPIIIGPNKDEDLDSPEVEINQMSGYNGFTLQSDGKVDSNGQVQYALFAITYQPKVSDVEIEVSDYEDAFAARMGDGTDIILSNPKVIEATRTGGTVQFKMEKMYPSNSPCQLMYRTNKAFISIGEDGGGNVNPPDPPDPPVETCAHENTKEVVTKQATCTESGSKEIRCADCNELISTQNIAATGHSMSDWRVTKQPTCSETGTRVKSCSKCGFVETEEIPKLQHSFNDTTHTCDNCGKIDPNYFDTDLRNWQYTLDEENDRVYLEKYKGSNQSVKIKESYLYYGTRYKTYLANNCSKMFYHNSSSGSTKPVTDIEFPNGLDTSNVTGMSQMFSNTSLSIIKNLSVLNTSNVTNMDNMFDGSAITSLDLTTFDVSKVKSISGMFANCKALQSVDTSNWTPNSLESIWNLFTACASLKNITINWYVPKVTEIFGMFVGCDNLTTINLSNFRTSSTLTSLSTLVYQCPVRTLDVSNINTSGVTMLNGVFSNCSNLVSITGLNGWNTNNVEKIYTMFAGCTSLQSLDLSNWVMPRLGANNTDNNKNKFSLQSMFSGLTSLTSVNLSSFNPSGYPCTSTYCMFNGCTNLKTINLRSFDTKYVEDVRQMFGYCSNLTSVTVSKLKWKISSSTEGYSTMYYNSSMNESKYVYV